MTVLDKFLSFAKALPADQFDALEESLAALMDSMSAKYDFTASELAELQNRAGETAPQFSDPADIAAIFGKPFRTK